MLASTRRISLCIFCISGSTPDNDASAGHGETQKQIVTLGAPNNSTAETSALPQHSITSKVPVRARKHRFDSSGSVCTCGEHLVDVFESTGLVHFSGEISPRARARRIWWCLEGSGKGRAVRRSWSGGERASGCPSPSRWEVERGGIAGGYSPSSAARPFNGWRPDPANGLWVGCCPRSPIARLLSCLVGKNSWIGYCSTFIFI
jgi:hypothetical protein